MGSDSGPGTFCFCDRHITELLHPCGCKGVHLITHVSPLGSMDLLSQLEVDMLKRTASSDLYQLFRNCSLAVLNSGSQTDSSHELLSRFESFDINVLRRERGVKLELINPPEEAFVDGRIIRALQANLFAVLRDILVPQRPDR